MALDNFRTQKIIWDRANKKIFETIEANSGDSNGRKLVVQVINQEVTEGLSGTTLSLGWKSRKGAKGLDAFKVVDASKGIFEIYYTTEMLSNIGNLEASLILIDSTGRIESDTFTISIRPSTVDDGSVESENSFTALTEALVKVNDLEGNYAPRLNEVTAQLAQTQFQPSGFVHRNSALFDTNFDRKATLSFVTDDGNIEDLTHYNPLFDEFGYKFTMAIQTGYVDVGVDKLGNKVMTWEQIKFLSNEGHTVSAHTVTHPHLNQISTEDKVRELKESRDTLLSKGFDVRHIMYPHGSRDAETINLTKKYYLSGANVIATANSSNTDRGDINRISILGTSLDRMKQFIDDAIENDYWIVFYFHGYEARYTHLGFMEKLRGILEYTRDSGIEVMTYDDAYDYFMRKKPITEIPTAKVGSYHMTTSQSIDDSVPHVTVDMPNFNAQRTNTDNFYFFNREKNRIEFPKAGTYLIEYGLLLYLEKDAQAFIRIMFGAEMAGTTLLSRELHQNFYVSQAYLDKENNNQRPYPVSGSAVVSFTQGSYDKFFISLPVRIKGQTMTKQNNISAWGESTHITITKLS